MNPDWYVFQGREPGKDYKPRPEAIAQLPDPPQWRQFRKQESSDNEPSRTKKERRGKTFFPSREEKEMVNAALYLRRPLLVTGRPGTGKTSLAYAVAYELDLGEVLYWPITTRTTLRDGLYDYDALGRMQDFQMRGRTEDRIEKYIRLGPLGTAFLPNTNQKPRVLLIDEIDKSDIDLPNDLLHIFEEGEFGIPELERIADEASEDGLEVPTAYRDRNEPSYQPTAKIIGGRVVCQQFPFVILTSNGERDFPPAFLRRCLRLDIEQPDGERLEKIVSTQLELEGEDLPDKAQALIATFLEQRNKGRFLATDQLLNAVYLMLNEKAPKSLEDKLFRTLDK